MPKTSMHDRPLYILVSAVDTLCLDVSLCNDFIVMCSRAGGKV